jgi:hypothetical protein
VPVGGISLIGSMADEEKNGKSTPPGLFVSEDQRAQTARFLDELRKRLKRVRADPKRKLGPPRRPR